MEAQILQAVHVAFDATTNPALKEQAIQFITHIKSSPDAWKHSLNLLESNETLTSNVTFFVLQIINEQLPTLSDNDKGKVNNSILNHLKKIIDEGKVEEVFIRNALAKTLSLIFVYSTLSIYPNLISDLLALSYNGTSYNEVATDYYTRTLSMIHQEIGDQMIARDDAASERNTLLKDVIREKDMVNMTHSWKNILNYFASEKPNDKQLAKEIINSTIQCIGSYVSWIEINLILDQELMGNLYQFLQGNDQKKQIYTANAFNEILHKKMPPAKKLELMEFLNLGGVLSQITDVNSLDFDVALALSKLTNQIGSEVVLLLENSNEQELANDDLRNLASGKIIEIFPLIFNFLAHEYDDISLEVFPFIGNFLLFLKKQIVSEINWSIINNPELLTTLIKNIIMKLKFSDDDDGDDEETVEQFSEVRSKLTVFIDSIVLLDESLALDVLISCLEEFFQGKEWRTVELGLFVLNYYSDMLRNNIMNLPRTMINNSRPYFVFNEMLCKIINSSQEILMVHPLIQINFFELIMKHYSFFTNGNIQVEGVDKNEVLMKVLNIFVSNFGVFSDNEKVKYRSWYLFYRFIKMTKPSIDDYVTHSLIQTLLPLLEQNVEIISNKNKTLESIDLNLIEENGSFENQLYLFESIGLLITLMKDQDQKITMIESVLQPIFLTLERSIGSISNLTLPTLITVQHSLNSMGTIVKPFENEPLNSKLSQILSQISQVILITFESFINYNIIRSASQFCMVRLFLIQSKYPESDLANLLSKFISLLMSATLESNELISFLNFTSQLFHTTANQSNHQLYELLSSLLPPLTSKLVERINNPLQDDEPKEIQRSFLNLLIALSNDHLNSILIGQPANLTDLINLMFVYVGSTDSQITKLAVLELTVLIQGLGTGKVIDPMDKFKTDAQFDPTLLISNSIRLSVELVGSASGRDASGRLVLLEVVRLLKAIVHIGFKIPDANTLSKKKSSNGISTTAVITANDSLPEGYNEVMCEQVRTCLVESGMPVDMGTEFVKNLVSGTDRVFLKWLVGMLG